MVLHHTSYECSFMFKWKIQNIITPNTNIDLYICVCICMYCKGIWFVLLAKYRRSEDSSCIKVDCLLKKAIHPEKAQGVRPY